MSSRTGSASREGSPRIQTTSSPRPNWANATSASGVAGVGSQGFHQQGERMYSTGSGSGSGRGQGHVGLQQQHQEYSPTSPPLPSPIAPPKTPPSTHSIYHSPSTSFSSYNMAHTLPSLATTSPPRGTTPPPLPHNIANPGHESSPVLRNLPPRTSSNPSSPSTVHSASTGGSGSLRKKAPPPLELRRGPSGSSGWEIAGGKTAKGDSSDSSETDDGGRDWRDENPSEEFPPPPQHVQSRSELEERGDTLSNLFDFKESSGATRGMLDTSIPDSQLDFETDGDEEERLDDTGHTNYSYTSSSTDSSGGGGAPRQYTGLGLGLPFSMSASANLSSLGPSSSSATPLSQSLGPSSSQHPSIQPLSIPTSPTQGPESPVMDRSKLIGLGELATPRWTSAALERKWGAPYEATTEQAKNRKLDESDEQRRDPMPTYRPATGGSSPSLSRPSLSRASVSGGSSNSGYESSSAYPNAVHPSALFPNSFPQSASLASLPTATGLIDFKNDLNQFVSSPMDDLRPTSMYSLDAVSINDEEGPGTEILRSSQLADEPRRSDLFGKRKSVGAAVSAPASASGSEWTSNSNIGLGFEYEGSGGGLAPNQQRRVSAGSVSSRRSSTGRPHSTEIKSPKIGHLRRQSASKTGFAHLPPSPAASTVAAATGPFPPLPTPPSMGQTPPPTAYTLQSSTSTTATAASTATAGRTPDPARLSHHSFHSHHHSPSVIAASILRQTRDLEMEGVDIDTIATGNSGTAEALRKLDGLSSPRMSRVMSTGSGTVRSRTTSREAGTPPAKGEETRMKRRTRSSTGSSGSVLKDIEAAVANVGAGGATAEGGSSSKPPSLHSVPALPSPPLVTPQSASSSSIPRSPLSPQMSRTQSQSSAPASASASQRPSSTGTYEVPFPTAPLPSPFKRGSSSSASFTAGGGGTSTSNSRDSTSGTSLSSSSYATTAPRSLSSKNRRGSNGSDISSIHSGSESAPARPESSGVAGQVPPVPPLPKDWETYHRPSTGGASLSSAQNSPRLGDRRPSQASSYSEQGMLSPRAPDMEPSFSSGSSVSNKTPTRKWSISNAFSSKSKSPKPPSIKESSSYTDLVAAANQRNSVFGTHISDPLYPRRMASSTNDIAGLAASSLSHRDSHDSSATTSARSRLTFSKSDRGTSSPSTRSRTISTSSSSTTNTAKLPAAATPSVVTTSPGRSRSSLLSARRTPSGIPFFSRKSSTTSTNSPPSPEDEKADAPVEERSGRKSILGLNFLRSTASRREKEKAPPSPSYKRQTFSTNPAPREVGKVDEWGRRASVASSKASTSGLATRKRGKTLPGAMEEPQADAQPLNLPPMQMSALSPSTARRVDSLSSSTSTSSLASSKASTGGTRSLLPPGRAAKLQESVKANLPTIAGSPSSHSFATTDRVPSAESNRTTTPPPKSHTPTKIPRLHQRSATIASPKLSTRTSDSSLNRTISPPSGLAASKSSRRLSYYSATPETSVRLANSVSSSTVASENDAVGEFGAINREPGLQHGEKTLATRRRLDSEPSGIPRSRSTAGGQSLAAVRTPLESSTASTASRTSVQMHQRRTSLIAGEEAKAAASRALATPRASQTLTRSSASVNQGLSDSSSSSASTQPVRRVLSKMSDSQTMSSSRRVSALSTTDSLSSSKSSRNIPAKAGIPTRISKSSTTPALAAAATTDSGRSSSASTYTMSEDEIGGDAEMSAYVRKQQAKKAAAGVSNDAIRKMFEFPEPTPALPPLSPRDALKLYSHFLSDYEREEILEHEQVYFVGPNCDKKPASKDVPLNNFGFDDERGDYLLVPQDHILYRYEVVDVLGKGSFGQVLQCRDHKTGEMVAIKIIRNKKRFHHQALVEIKVLENLVKWDPDEKHFVIRMVDSFTFRGHLCIVTELLSINLYELVKANSFHGFTTTLIRRFTIQILGSLSLLRHQRVVHCDLKPENILLKHPAKSAIKVIDFGSSCFEHEKVYTYIQSRFYRSPEVILGMNYHMAIDMWSLGCIIAEMYTGFPIFPGENEQDQLSCIMEVMGVPDKYLIDRSSRKRLFFDSTGAPRPYSNSKGRRRRPGTKTLAAVLKSDDELFIDFIAKCLTWDPDRRLKPDPAARHPWIVANRQAAVVAPARSSRSPHTSASASSSTLSSSQISTPRKMKAASTATSGPSMATPLHSHYTSSAGAATAPTQRTRTQSTTSSVPRLTSKGSMGLPTSSRFSVKS